MKNKKRHTLPNNTQHSLTQLTPFYSRSRYGFALIGFSRSFILQHMKYRGLSYTSFTGSSLSILALNRCAISVSGKLSHFTNANRRVPFVTALISHDAVASSSSFKLEFKYSVACSTEMVWWRTGMKI